MAKRFEGVLSLPPKQETESEPKKKVERVQRDYPVAREVLFEFPELVSYHVSARAKRVQSKHLKAAYLQIQHGVSRGSVACYVFGTSQLARYRGQIITARLLIKEKIFADGRRVTYCDLELAPRKTATQELVIVKDRKAVPTGGVVYTKGVHGGFIVVVKK